MTEINKKIIANNFPCEIEFNGEFDTKLFTIINKQNIDELEETIPDNLNQKNLTLYKNYNYKVPLEDNQKITIFRGRELRSTNINLSTDDTSYKGNLFKNSRTRSFSNKPKSLIQISLDSYLQPLNDEEYEFDSIDAWQQDFAPFSALDSPLVGLKDWLKVSHNIHDPISEEEMNQ